MVLTESLRSFTARLLLVHCSSNARPMLVQCSSTANPSAHLLIHHIIPEVLRVRWVKEVILLVVEEIDAVVEVLLVVVYRLGRKEGLVGRKRVSGARG